MSFDAYWLPGSQPRAFRSQELPDGGTIRHPLLTPAELRDLCILLRNAGRSARDISARDRIAACARAARLLREPGAPYHTLALELLPQVTGYSAGMCRLVLERMTRDWSEPALTALVQHEFGSTQPLDFFAPDDGRRVLALGPELAVHIFSGNVPGVAVTSLLRALIVKAASFGKMATDEPVLPVLFARALHDVEPALARTMAVANWPGGTAELEAVLFEEASAAIVYGGEQVASSVRARLSPDTKLVVHGPRVSFAVVGDPALTDARLEQTAGELAQAVATFDQQGCVSPHLVYVAGSAAAAARLAAALAQSLEALQATLPRGRISAAEAVAIHNERARAEFGSSVLHEGANAAYTVVLDHDAAFEASCLNRFIRIKPIAAWRDLPALLAPVRRYLQSAALAGFSAADHAAISLELARAGVTRITSPAHLPWPPAYWHHDGAGPLRELVTFVDDEQTN